MAKPNINSTDVIKFAITLAVVAVGAALYIPSVAQQKVDDHAVKIEAPHEKAQDKKLEKLEEKMSAVQQTQVQLKTELKNTQSKLDETNRKIDVLLTELRRAR